jgi:hypothetical protein
MLIPAQVCKNVGMAAGKEAKRYSTDAVLLQRKDEHCIAAATDGHILLRLKWSDADRDKYPAVDGLSAEPKAGFSTLIHATELAEVSKMPPRRSAQRVLLDEQATDGTAVFGASTQTRRIQAVEGQFPSYEDCIPRYEVGRDAIEIGVSPELLTRLLTAMAGAATSCDNKGVRLVVPIRPTSPIVLESCDKTEGVEATAVLMPISLENPCTDRTPIRHASHLAYELGRMVQLVESMEQQVRKSPKIWAATLLATDEVVQALNSARWALEKAGCSVPAPAVEPEEASEPETTEADSAAAKAA